MKLSRIAFFLAFFCALFCVCGFSWPVLFQLKPQPTLPPTLPIPNETLPKVIATKQILTNSSTWVEQKLKALKVNATNIDTNILRLSLIAYQKAQHNRLMVKKHLLTVIDYSKPSTFKRLWVFDLESNKIVFNTWVSHGKNSGGIKPNSFSNTVGSLKSSIGVFLTDTAYYGGRGYSLRIKGLEHGINDNVYRRHVVFHGAPYINPVTIKRYGQVGRSWGCPAVSSSLIRPLINTIKDKTLLIVYYPDKHWLKSSRFLTG